MPKSQILIVANSWKISIYFGDNIVTEKRFWEDLPTKAPQRWFTEPQEVALGIRFTKQASSKSKKLEDYWSGSNHHLKELKEYWCHSAYIRIMNQRDATLTGSNQFQVGLLNMRAFDGALVRLIENPAIAYKRRVESSTYSSKGWGYNS